MTDSPTDTRVDAREESTNLDVFGDPVAYLSSFGITVVVVAETTMPAAA